MLNMVQSYATLERIGSQHLSNTMPSAHDIRNIPITSLLPSLEDEQELKSELSTLITRTLTTYIPAFSDLDTVWSIPHQYSAESKKKSEIVPLRILDTDEATTAGMIELLEQYTKYVPEDPNGMPVPLLLFCDGLSCERIEGAQRARINGDDSWARLQMYEPGIQEWHRRLMFVQDTYDDLFKYESHREKGTLYNLKQVYDHKGVTKNVMDCFNKAEELLDFATDGYVILYAMELMKMTDINSVNVSGGKRKNVPKDLHCEHLNREYKENSRDAGGQLTKNTVNRHSQMLGIGKKISGIFAEQVVFSPCHTRKHGRVDRTKDVLHMVKSLKSQNLFKFKIGRAFNRFDEFKMSKVSRFSKNFRERLLRHLENMAVVRETQMQTET